MTVPTGGRDLIPTRSALSDPLAPFHGRPARFTRQRGTKHRLVVRHQRLMVLDRCMGPRPDASLHHPLVIDHAYLCAASTATRCTAPRVPRLGSHGRVEPVGVSLLIDWWMKLLLPTRRSQSRSLRSASLLAGSKGEAAQMSLIVVTLLDLGADSLHATLTTSSAPFANRRARNNPPQRAMPSAVERVWDVAELQDAILARLGAADLLCIRAVCKTLSRAVLDSPRSAALLYHADVTTSSRRSSPGLRYLCQSAGIGMRGSTSHLACLLLWASDSHSKYRFLQSSDFLAKMMLGHPAPRRIRIFRLCNCRPWRTLLREVTVLQGVLLLEDLAELVLDCAHAASEPLRDPTWCSRCRRSGTLHVLAF